MKNLYIIIITFSCLITATQISEAWNGYILVKPSGSALCSEMEGTVYANYLLEQQQEHWAGYYTYSFYFTGFEYSGTATSIIYVEEETEPLQWCQGGDDSSWTSPPSSNEIIIDVTLTYYQDN